MNNMATNYFENSIKFIMKLPFCFLQVMFASSACEISFKFSRRKFANRFGNLSLISFHRILWTV